MITLLIFLIIFGILIIVHEFGHFIVAKKSGVRVDTFSIGFGPKLLRRKKGGTEYLVSLVPLGGYVKLAGDNLEEYKGKPDEYLSQPIKTRAGIIFCGPFLNYLLGILIFWFVFFTGFPAATSRVGEVIDDFGAKEAGLKPQDKIIAIDGKRIVYWDELQKVIQEKASQPNVNLAVLREGKELTVAVKIKQQEFTDIFGKKHTLGLIGIAPSDETIKLKYGILKSFSLSIGQTWKITAVTYAGLWQVITGKLSMRESMTGPLGIFYITAKAAKFGLVAVLHLLALLSISLAIFNLLPLPVLDGGHLFLLGLEKIRGKALGIKAERWVSQTGMTLMIGLAVLVTFNDIIRLFGNKISGLFK